MSDENTLSLLYPWQHGEAGDPAQLRAQLAESIQGKADDSAAIKRQFFADNEQALLNAAEALARVFAGGGRLYTMGNGGSSCDAAHVAVEFSHPVTTGRPALPAMNLGADTAMLTAVGNDVGMAHVFLRQLTAHARAGDALLGISTSGNSDNLMAAFEKAHAMGVITIGLAGGDGGSMVSSEAMDYCLSVDSHSIHRVQETHVAIYHILWDLVHSLLAGQRGRT